MEIKSVVGKIDSNTFVVTQGDTTFIVDAGAQVKKVLAALGGKRPAAIQISGSNNLSI